MFLPIGDSPNPTGTPWVTYALIAINVAVYLVLVPLSFQPAEPGDPALREYVLSIAEERDLSRDQVLTLAGQVSEALQSQIGAPAPSSRRYSTVLSPVSPVRISRVPVSVANRLLLLPQPPSSTTSTR